MTVAQVHKQNIAALADQVMVVKDSETQNDTANQSSKSNNSSTSYAKRFTATENGVYFNEDDTDAKSGDIQTAQVFICSPLRVIAITRQGKKNFGKLLEWQDVDGNKHQWAMPMSMLASDGVELRRELLDAGLPFISSSRKARQLLVDYISTQTPKERANCVDKIGWHDHAYVLPDMVIGCTDQQRVILQTTSAENNHFTVRGSMEDWRDNIGGYCIGNSRLAFAVSTAFAAPLLHLIHSEGGGFNLRGSSSQGKSTALRVAASVCGGADFLQSWRATDNALEATACSHNDALLPLDEMGEVPAKLVGQIAYMLANGFGKSRALRDGSAKPKRRWRTLFLSTGELSLGELMDSIGQTVKAGQEIRLVDIPMDTGIYGGFENLHSMDNGAAFAEYLNEQVTQYHGAVFRDFLKKTQQQRGDISARIREIQQQFIQANVPAGASGQVSRVAARFGLVVAGGELATALGLTGWPEGEAQAAGKKCFAAWLKSRGHNGNIEDQKALEQVVRFYQLNGQSRFAVWGDGQEKVVNRAGYIYGIEDQTWFYTYPQIFKSEVCKGYSFKRMIESLKQKSLIQTDHGRNDISRNGERFICVSAKITGQE